MTGAKHSDDALVDVIIETLFELFSVVSIVSIMQKVTHGAFQMELLKQ